MERERGSAGIKITLHDGVMCVYHEQDGTLLYRRPLYEGEWSELFDWIRRDEE